MQRDFRIFEQDQKPCRRCQGTVVKKKLSGRTTYFCQQCQS